MLTIRKAFLLICVLLVAVPLALFWAWPHTRAVHNEFEEVRDRHLLLARTAATALQRHHRDLTAAFDDIAGRLLAGERVILPEPVRQSLRLRQVWLIDAATGRVLAEAAGPAGSGQLPLDPLRLAATDGSFGIGTQITGVQLAADGSPFLALVRKQGTRLAIATLDTAYFAELAAGLAFGQRGHAVIVDQSGRVLAHPRPEWARAAKDLSANPAVSSVMRGETGVTRFVSPAFGEEMIAGFAPALSTPWSVMVAQPLAELSARARAVDASARSVLMIGLVIATLVALRLGLVIVNPIRNMIAVVQRMESGDLSARLTVSGRFVPSEIRTLQSAFNAMVERNVQAHARVCEARMRAERASTAKSDFLRFVTHELRSPTNAIIGFSELLASERLGPLGAPSYREHVRDIVAGSRHLLSLINDLLDLSKIEAGQYDLEPEPIGIDELLERCARYLRPALTERRIALDYQPGPKVPILMVDERAMFQVLLNLATNAVRYGNEGGRIRLDARLLADGGAEIVVEDDGPGIPAGDLARVMEPFQRVASLRNRGVQGTGLGLPIVKRLVELHGGTFVLESEVGCGTSARIRLPASRVVAAPPAPATLAIAAAA